MEEVAEIVYMGKVLAPSSTDFSIIQEIGAQLIGLSKINEDTFCLLGSE